MSESNRQSPSVTMSRPATSCSCRYTDRASTYCSRNRDSTIASRKERVPRFSVYQLGRGSEPVMVVGMIFPAVAFSIGCLLVRSNLVRYQPPRCGVNCVRRKRAGRGFRRAESGGCSPALRTELAQVVIDVPVDQRAPVAGGEAAERGMFGPLAGPLHRAHALEQVL